MQIFTVISGEMRKRVRAYTEREAACRALVAAWSLDDNEKLGRLVRVKGDDQVSYFSTRALCNDLGLRVRS